MICLDTTARFRGSEGTMRIASVEARTVRIPLPIPLRTADLEIRERDFALTRVRLEDGTEGVGFTLSRGGLVAESVERNLAPSVLGEDIRMLEALWERCFLTTRYLGRKGLLMRALSSLDIALWDAKSQWMGVPLWSLVGGYQRQLPVYVAGGYYRAEASLAALEKEFAGYRERGYAGAKLNVGGLSLADDLSRVRAARAGWGDGAPLIADFNGALRDVRTALHWAQALRDSGVTIIEEPFLMEHRWAWEGFRERSPLAVAIGEDESGRASMHELLRCKALDIARHDATLIGGVGEWLKVSHLAQAHGVSILPHWFPELHRQLAFATPGCLAIEVVDPNSGVMEWHRLFHGDHDPLSLGELNEEPGLGVRWNWEAIDRWSAL
jgi:D-arabinonate dehydratase